MSSLCSCSYNGSHTFCERKTGTQLSSSTFFRTVSRSDARRTSAPGQPSQRLSMLQPPRADTRPPELLVNEI